MGLPRLSAGRRTNLALLILIPGAFATGGLAFALGSGWVRWVVVGHGAAGVAILLLSPWKTTIARRGLRRNPRGSWASGALSVLVAAAVVFGVAHATGLPISVGGVSAMRLHVGAALASVPFAVWHVIARPVRVRRTDASRRTVLRAGTLLGGTILTYGVVEGLVHVVGLPGRARRFTGSHETASLRPAEMPVTQWLSDQVPGVDPERWRLAIRADGSQRTWTYDELASFHDRMRATIDCTGGWFSLQDWEGALLARLVPHVGEGRSVAVRSITGYGRRFPIGEAGKLLVATRAGGEPLSAGHGFPVRIVAPGRRGFWWVKWVTTVEVSPAPWWWQPPFPLT